MSACAHGVVDAGIGAFESLISGGLCVPTITPLEAQGGYKVSHLKLPRRHQEKAGPQADRQFLVQSWSPRSIIEAERPLGRSQSGPD